MVPSRWGNLLEGLPRALATADGNEIFETLAETAGARVERIVSTGQASPEGFWYDQPGDELVLVVRGAASLEIEGREAPIDLTPGGWVLIPARCRHRVARTAEDEPTVWLAVHLTATSA